MAGLAALALADQQRACIGAVVPDLEPAELTVAAAGRERAAHQIAEVGRAGVEQTTGLVGLQIAQPRRVGTAERLHLAPYLRVERANCPFPILWLVRPDVVQGGFQDCQEAVGAALPGGLWSPPGWSAPHGTVAERHGGF
jgi:hypothetical protein